MNRIIKDPKELLVQVTSFFGEPPLHSDTQDKPAQFNQLQGLPFFTELTW